MNESETIIKAALERRFARVPVPDLPQGPWRSQPAPARRPRFRSRGFVYASVVLGALAVAGVGAQASDTLRADFARFFPLNGSSKPLPPMIHRADRLTIAQAQQRMPFTIVVPAGLPPNTTLQYAHVVSEQPVPRVALNYQALIGGRYYRININETTSVSGPPVAHFDVMFKAKDGQTHHQSGTLPLRRWKHGDVIMEMLPEGLPPAVSERIVRANTL
ncbi:MAG TPA: hypothetical protein VHS78_13350 [Candidatus Elarobacter sp.]|jgi:hypothetical protein|nr:hypothetical protein [Candidatus Elarobacter sp.]